LKNLRVFLVIAFGFSLLISACQVGNPLEPPNCRKGTCVKVNITQLGELGEDSILTMTINSEAEEPGTKVYLQFSAPDVLVDGQPTQAERRSPLKDFNIKPRQPVTVTVQVRFPREGYFQIAAHAYTKDGRDVIDAFWVRVTGNGITPNPAPERGPGTPAPAMKVDKTPTPRPQTLTPNPPPTRSPY
jgi:hypothetical protein